MVIPVGSLESQQLQFIRMMNGQPVISLRDSVRFVPLIPIAIESASLSS